jgi:hypothetical protein
VRKLAYQYAAANKLKYPHQWDENKLARGEWMRAFLKKYVTIYLSISQKLQFSLGQQVKCATVF